MLGSVGHGREKNEYLVYASKNAQLRGGERFVRSRKCTKSFIDRLVANLHFLFLMESSVPSPYRQGQSLFFCLSCVALSRKT